MTRISIGGRGASGLLWPNYVNGRLLTATDLRTDQNAVLQRDRWLGDAIGSGVVRGLEVSGSAGSIGLRVSPGTGVCPGGTVLHLDADATLELSVVTTRGTTIGADRFASCEPASTETKAPVAGAYLLVARPASSYDGSVPVKGHTSASGTVPCASRWEVDEVAFAAIRLDGFTTSTTNANRRNLLAHWCFGSSELDDLAMSGFDAPLSFRGLDTLADLGPCDLPLAVFDWNGSNLVFVDRWSARRRTVRPPATDALAEVVNDRRTADGEARFLQFQEQVTATLAAQQGATTRALDVFPLLPPAGLLPIDPQSSITPLLRLAKLQPSVGSVVGPEPVISAQPVGSAQPDASGVFMMAASTDHRFRAGGADNSTLGFLAATLQRMQAEIDALEAQLAKLQAGTGGPGGAKSSASARTAGRKIADWVTVGLALATGAGVDPTTFFDGVSVRFGVVDRETVDFTIRRSWYDEAVELGDGPELDVFFVTKGDTQQVAPYVLFTKRIRPIRWIDTRARAIGT